MCCPSSVLSCNFLRYHSGVPSVMDAANADTGDLVVWLVVRSLRRGVEGAAGTGLSMVDGDGERVSGLAGSASGTVNSFAYSGRMVFASDSKDRSMAYGKHGSREGTVWGAQRLAS